MILALFALIELEQ